VRNTQESWKAELIARLLRPVRTLGYDPNMRLNRAMIYVKDINRMATFYGNTLGLKPVEETRMENWVEFEAGPTRFSLHSIPIEIADQIQISSPPRPREKNPVKLSFEVDDIAAERQRLESLGVTIVQRPWGAYDGIDPEGSIFGIYSAAQASRIGGQTKAPRTLP
jgi:catechol 2,3-dioxygenase-like lactoylglutathione lyase family enzyme